LDRCPGRSQEHRLQTPGASHLRTRPRIPRAFAGIRAIAALPSSLPRSSGLSADASDRARSKPSPDWGGLPWRNGGGRELTTAFHLPEPLALARSRSQLPVYSQAVRRSDSLFRLLAISSNRQLFPKMNILHLRGCSIIPPWRPCHPQPGQIPLHSVWWIGSTTRGCLRFAVGSLAFTAGRASGVPCFELAKERLQLLQPQKVGTGGETRALSLFR
jgi:hypothetical protein